MFLVDFDQFCLTDPALDVGYFLAYLRPAGLWYHRAGRRAWFEAAAERSSRPICTACRAGRVRGPCAGIAGRAPVFEAALLLKIAARRANRLHSPRPGEVAAVLERSPARSRSAEPPGGRSRARSAGSSRQVQHGERPVVEIADVAPAAVRRERHGGGRRARGDAFPVTVRLSASMTETVLSLLLTR